MSTLNYHHLRYFWAVAREGARTSISSSASGTLPDLLRGLDAHAIDVVLANHAPPRDAATSFVPHAIAEQPVSLVGRPSRRRRPAELARILAARPVILPTTESGVRAGFDALAERLGVRPRVVAEVDDMAMLRLMARERVGLRVVPPIVVKDELETGTLVEVARLPGMKETFVAITPTRRFPNPLVKELLTSSLGGKRRPR